jgi:hemolysin III
MKTTTAAACLQPSPNRLVGRLSAVPRQERFNVLSHGAAAAACLPATLVLAAHAAESGRADASAALLVHGFTISLALLASACFHAASGPRRERLRRLDRAAIFVAVAGFHTANVLVAMASTAGLFLLAAVWLGASRQIRLELRAPGAGRLTIAPYLRLGAAGLIYGGQLAAALPPAGTVSLGSAALVLVVGSGVVRAETVPYRHEIWHVLVVIGNGLALAGWATCAA